MLETNDVKAPIGDVDRRKVARRQQHLIGRRLSFQPAACTQLHGSHQLRNPLHPLSATVP